MQDDCHPYLRGVVMAALGTQHTMVLDEEGLMYSWGNSDLGALGLGDREDDYEKKVATRSLLVRYSLTIGLGANPDIH